MIRIAMFISLVLSLWQQCDTMVSQQRMYKSGDVILGGLFPLHVRTSDDMCGEFFRYGLDYVEAMVYAIEQVNANQEILPNVTIGYDIRDFCDSPTLALKEAYDIATTNKIRMLLQKRKYQTNASSCDFEGFGSNEKNLVVAIVGPVDSSSCLLVASLLKVVQIPGITAFATSEELSSGFDSFFRTVPSDSQQVKAIADIIEHFNWSYVAIIAVDHSYGRYAVKALEQEEDERKTFCVAMTGYFPQSGYEEKIQHIISELKRRTNIQVIILWSTYTPGLRVVREAANQRLYGRTWLISEGLAMQGPGFFGEEEKYVVEGFIGILHPKFKDNGFEEYLRSAKEKNRKSSNLSNPWWSEFYKTENQTKNANSTARFPENTHLPYTEYLIDAVHAIAHALDVRYRCTTGDSSNIFCPSLIPRDNPEELIPFMRNVNFKGLTGRVEFDTQGDPLSSSYDVINFQLGSSAHAQDEYVKIATWNGEDSQRLKKNEKNIIWGRNRYNVPISVCKEPCPPGTRQTKTTACCWDCNVCPDGTINPAYSSPNCTKCRIYMKPNVQRTRCIDLPLTNLLLTDPGGIVYSSITCTGIGFVIFTLVVFIKYRNSPVVKSSDRTLSFILLFGIFLCFALAFLYLLYPTPLLCKILLPGRYIVYTICVSVLLVKTNRIVRLFDLQSIPTWIKEILLRSKGQITLIIFLNLIQILLGIILIVLDPPFHKINVQESVGKWYSCRHFENTIHGILEGTMFAYLICLLFFCSFYAFKARKLPENYNEARYIGFSMYILVFSWISFYPVASAIEGNVFVHIACITTLVSAYGMLGCLFCPKLYIILIHPEKNTLAFVKASVVDYTIRSVSKMDLSASKSSVAQ